MQDPLLTQSQAPRSLTVRLCSSGTKMERLKRKKLDPRHHGPHRAYVHAKGLRLEPLVDACIAAESTAAAGRCWLRSILLYGGLPAALLKVHWDLGTEGVPVKSWRTRSGKKLVRRTVHDASHTPHRFSWSAELCGVYGNVLPTKVMRLWQRLQ